MQPWPLADDSPRVAVAADWGGAGADPRVALAAIADLGIGRLHLVGDLDLGASYLDRLDTAARHVNVRISITPGGSAIWPAELVASPRLRPASPFALRPNIVWLSLGQRWVHNDCAFLSCGSPGPGRDFPRLREDWWDTQDPAQVEVARVISGGHADVVLALDSPFPGTPAVDRLRNFTETRTSDDAHTADAWSLEGFANVGVTSVWDEVEPDLLLHGHWGVQDLREFDFGQRVISLAGEGSPGNVAIVDLHSVTARWIEDVDV